MVEIIQSVRGVKFFEEFRGVYRMDLTTCRELRAKPWRDGYTGMMITTQPASTVFCVILTPVC